MTDLTVQVDQALATLAEDATNEENALAAANAATALLQTQIASVNSGSSADAVELQKVLNALQAAHASLAGENPVIVQNLPNTVITTPSNTSADPINGNPVSTADAALTDSLGKDRQVDVNGQTPVASDPVNTGVPVVTTDGVPNAGNPAGTNPATTSTDGRPSEVTQVGTPNPAPVGPAQASNPDTNVGTQGGIATVASSRTDPVTGADIPTALADAAAQQAASPNEPVPPTPDATADDGDNEPEHEQPLYKFTGSDESKIDSSVWEKTDQHDKNGNVLYTFKGDEGQTEPKGASDEWVVEPSA